MNRALKVEAQSTSLQVTKCPDSLRSACRGFSHSTVFTEDHTLGGGLGAGDQKNKLEMVPDLTELIAQWRGNKKQTKE